MYITQRVVLTRTAIINCKERSAFKFLLNLQNGLLTASNSNGPPTNKNNVSISDYQSICNTINGFLWCLDRNRSDQFADLFQNDKDKSSSCEIVKAGVRVTGRESLKKLCEDLHLRFKPAIHMETNIHVTTINDNLAKNESYWMAVLGGEIISTGSHEDELIRCDSSGLWRFQKRIIRHHWTKAGGFEESRI